MSEYPNLGLSYSQIADSEYGNIVVSEPIPTQFSSEPIEPIFRTRLPSEPIPDLVDKTNAKLVKF
jgi:hypothetical protein